MGCPSQAPSRIARGRYTLRISFLEQQAAKNALLCDMLLSPGSERAFQLPAGRTPIAVLVEAFDGQQLALVGEQRFDPTRQVLTVPMRPAVGFGCAETLPSGRAFHTSTTLPNGDVLLLGGLLSDADNAALTTQALAHRTGVLFDPRTGKLSILDGLPPRVFHQTVMLPGPANGPHRVLVLGGLTAAQPSEPVVRLRQGNPVYPFLVSPHESASAAEGFLLTVDVQVDPPTTTVVPLSQLPRGITMQTAFDAQGKLHAVGGATEYVASATSVSGFAAAGGVVAATLGSLNDTPTIESTVNLAELRVGHAIAPLPNGDLLVLGGVMSGASGTEHTTLLERVDASSSTAQSLSPPVVPTAWHTLASLGEGKQLLWAGGMRLTPGATNDYRFAVDIAADQPALILLDASQQTITATDVTGVGGFTRAGYHRSTMLAGQRVLLSGGNVPTTAGSAFAASDQVAVYRFDAQRLVRELSGAGLHLDPPRFAHGTSLLIDQGVLISGGVTLEDGSPRLSSNIQFIDARTGSAAEDPFARPALTLAQSCPGN